jgi:hypothetical protein
MPRKPAVLGLAAALAVGGTSIATAGDDGRDGRTIRLTAENTGLSIVDNGQPGLNRGDRAVIEGDLLRGGQKMGEAALDCVVISVDGPRLQNQCAGSAALPDGGLVFQGLAAADTAASVAGTVAVTGGTGRFRRAHGEATMTVSAGGLTGDVVIRLR